MIERRFTPSTHDPCLSINHDMIYIVYVDVTISCGPNSKAIQNGILGIRISKHEQHQKIELRDEGEAGDFLGIRIENVDLVGFIWFKQGYYLCYKSMR